MTLGAAFGRHQGRNAALVISQVAALGAALGMAAVWTLTVGFALPVFGSGEAAQVLTWRWNPEAGLFGVLPMLWGSLLLAGLALLLALPLSLGLACRMRLTAATGRRSTMVRLVRFMTTVPTVVYGFASLFLLTPLVRAAAGGSGLCWLTAALVLALLIVPTMVLVIEAALATLHRQTALTAAALGFSPAGHLAFIALPAARRWIVGAGMLGLGRALGDTLIPLMLAGNAPQVALHPLDSLRTLSAHMGLATATEAGSTAYNSLFMAAALLCLVSMGTSLAVRLAESVRFSGSATSLAALPCGTCWKPAALRLLAGGSSLLVGGAVGALLLFLLWQGVPSLGLSLFFGDTPPLAALSGRLPVWDGIWPACAGTLTLLGLTMLLALPPGIGCGIYLAEYASPRQRRVLSLLVDAMAGLPSIAVGFFGFLLILSLRPLYPGAQPGLMLAAACLALLVLPSLITATRTALESLPPELRLTALALGFSPGATLRHVLLPQAGTGLLGGVMLAMGRAAEDTAVIILTGVVANAGLPAGLWQRFEALPFMIYYTAAQYQDEAELARGFGAALVLLALSGSLLLAAQALQKRVARGHKEESPC